MQLAKGGFFAVRRKNATIPLNLSKHSEHREGKRKPPDASCGSRRSKKCSQAVAVTPNNGRSLNQANICGGLRSKRSGGGVLKNRSNSHAVIKDSVALARQNARRGEKTLPRKG